jgi:hypothetical protein
VLLVLKVTHSSKGGEPPQAPEGDRQAWHSPVGVLTGRGACRTCPTEMMALSSKSGEEDHECSTPKLAGATMGEHCCSTPEEDEATVVES